MNLEMILVEDDIIKSITSNLNYLLSIIPEIKDMIGFDHNHPHHHLYVWNHTLLALSKSENDFEIRLSLLLHDIGKPHCFQDNEIRHFKGHQKVSSDMTRNILQRLSYNNEFIEKICYLIENHDTPITSKDIINDYDLEYKRYKIQSCDALAHHPDKLEKRIEYLAKTNLMFKEIKRGCCSK